MEFGRVLPGDLNDIDFSLPPDPLFNKEILKGEAKSKPRVYVGCAKWGRPEWVGKIYPQMTREKAFLDCYIEHFNSVELNTTHYKVYGPKAIHK